MSERDPKTSAYSILLMQKVETRGDWELIRVNYFATSFSIKNNRCVSAGKSVTINVFIACVLARWKHTRHTEQTLQIGDESAHGVISDFTDSHRLIAAPSRTNLCSIYCLDACESVLGQKIFRRSDSQLSFGILHNGSCRYHVKRFDTH